MGSFSRDFVEVRDGKARDRRDHILVVYAPVIIIYLAAPKIRTTARERGHTYKYSIQYNSVAKKGKDKSSSCAWHNTCSCQPIMSGGRNKQACQSCTGRNKEGCENVNGLDVNSDHSSHHMC